MTACKKVRLGDEGDEFGILYNEIVALLAQYGVDDALGHGDYDISGDNYNNRDFYVLVNNISVIHPEWIPPIQAILKRLSRPWVVHIRLGIPADDQRIEVDCPGLEISSAQVIERWDKPFLAATFGSDFHFMPEVR